MNEKWWRLTCECISDVVHRLFVVECKLAKLEAERAGLRSKLFGYVDEIDANKEEKENGKEE